jgi:DnaD/phage-associated family protein
MSGLIVGLVFELPITDEFTSEMKFTAAIYADHAWQDGTHAHPAVQTVASKTGYHERSVQRYLRELERLGILIRDGKGPRGTNNYKFPLEVLESGYRLNIKLNKGDTMPPRQPATGDTDSGDTDSGDTSVTRTNQPSLVLVVINADIAEISKTYEQEFGALTPMIADAIQDAVNTYPPEWIPEAMQIAVASNKRNWKYVEGILKNCKAKNIRPSLNRLEKTNGNHNSGNQQRPKQSKPGKPNPAVEYSQADLDAAARINARV